MLRRTVSGLLLALLIIGFFVPIFNVHPVWASGTIYIRADGSVDPPSAPVNRDGNVYSLTGDIVGSIVVEKDNIAVDGAGHTLQGAGSGTGVSVNARNNVIVKNMQIRNFREGIYLASSSYNSISSNRMTVIRTWEFPPYFIQC